MDRERFKALCALYFFNTIQPDELKELRTALNSGDKDLQEIFSRTKKSIDKLSFTVDLLDKIGDSNQNSMGKIKKVKKRKIFPLYKNYHHDFESVKFNIISAICILFLISLLILTFYLLSILNTNSILNNKILGFKSNLGKDSRILNVLNSKQIEIINLEGLDINPGGYGKIFWSPFSREAVLQVSNLPPIDNNQEYRLWLKKDNTFTSEAIITSDKFNPVNFYYVKNLPINNEDSTYTIILTLDAKGKADKPTSTIYLKGGR